MELDPDDLATMLSLFSVELAEHRATLESGLLGLESQGSAPETLDEMFRAAHNVKGSATSLGVTSLALVAHELESVLDELRRGDRQLSANQTDACLAVVDAMQPILESHRDNDTATADDEATAAAGRLRRSLEDTVGPVPPARPAGPYVDGPHTRGSLTHESVGQPEGAAAGSTDAGSPVHRPPDDPGEPAGAAGAPEPEPGRNAAEPTGRATPAPSDDGTRALKAGDRARETAERVRRVETIRVSASRFEKVSSLADSMQLAKIVFNDQLAEYRTLTRSAEALATRWSAQIGDLPEGVPEDARASWRRLSDQFGDLRAGMTRLESLLRGLSRQLTTSADALQAELRHVRLEPMSSLVDGLRRDVRDLSRTLGKQAVLEAEGSDTEVDRVILDRLREPLQHLLRNAVDHGLETPEERSGAGKPEQGRISVRIVRDGHSVQLRLSDDGRGMDVDALRAAAVTQGLLAESEAASLPEAAVLDLVFRPAFSTRSEANEISGRGVGLDVVRSHLHQLKGSVTVSTEAGSGTTFAITFPVTVQNEEAVLVNVGGMRFAIPISGVQRVMSVRPEEIVSLAGVPAVDIGGRSRMIVNLGDVLQVASLGSRGEDATVAVLERGQDAVAFVVDEIEGQREVLVRPLSYPLVSVRCVSGGSVTGRGDVVVVLNPDDLVEEVLGRDEIAPAHPTTGLEVTEEPLGRRRVLLAEDSFTTRTLELNILRSAGYEVDVAVDGLDAWQQLQQSRFDLLLTDVEMPNMSGFELVERLRAEDASAGLPVVIVSSRDSQEDRERGAEVGADAYLAKADFQTGRLLETVERLIGS